MKKFEEYLEAIKKKRIDEDEEENVGDEVERGDYVDFGIYGKLWVVREDGGQLWVTDEKKDKNNPNASGWYIHRRYAKRIIRKANKF